MRKVDEVKSDEEANHRDCGEDDSSRAHRLPDGTDHDLVFGLRPVLTGKEKGVAISRNSLIFLGKNAIKKLDFVLFLEKSCIFAPGIQSEYIVINLSQVTTRR